MRCGTCGHFDNEGTQDTLCAMNRNFLLKKEQEKSLNFLEFI